MWVLAVFNERTGQSQQAEREIQATLVVVSRLLIDKAPFVPDTSAVLSPCCHEWWYGIVLATAVVIDPLSHASKMALNQAYTTYGLHDTCINRNYDTNDTNVLVWV